MYPAVLLMYFISAAVILLAFLALIVQVLLQYNNTGRASVGRMCINDKCRECVKVSGRCKDLVLTDPDNLHFSRLKRRKREADHSSPPSTEVRNEGSYTSIPPISIYGVDRNKFTFLL